VVTVVITAPGYVGVVAVVDVDVGVAAMDVVASVDIVAAPAIDACGRAAAAAEATSAHAGPAAPHAAGGARLGNAQADGERSGDERGIQEEFDRSIGH
jgi:hypothetical protein